jgi:hypothetical protein
MTFQELLASAFLWWHRVDFAYFASMSTISIDLPDSIYQRAEALAREDGQPLESFVVSILSQRVAVAEADSYVRRRAARGSAEKMLDLLSIAPAIEPPEDDKK